MPKKQIIVSGIQPSGDMHIGNYLGAIKNWIDLQNSGKYECFFFIADLHSLTEDFDAKEKSEQIARTVAELLAIGIDPKKSTLFIQSHVPEHTELMWYLNCLVPITELERMTQYKDKASRQKKNINVGLFSYPILQAADILMYKADAIPVGEDQVQHIELTRKIARLFNARFGKGIFVEPKPLLTKAVRIKSLADSSKKMSKSLGEKHFIALADEPKVVTTKIKKAVTDAEGVKNLINLLGFFAGEKSAAKYKQRGAQFKELKLELASAVIEKFAEFRAKRDKFLKNKSYLAEELSRGQKKAQKNAINTMAKIRQSIGVR